MQMKREVGVDFVTRWRVSNGGAHQIEILEEGLDPKPGRQNRIRTGPKIGLSLGKIQCTRERINLGSMNPDEQICTFTVRNSPWRKLKCGRREN